MTSQQFMLSVPERTRDAIFDELYQSLVGVCGASVLRQPIAKEGTRAERFDLRDVYEAAFLVVIDGLTVVLTAGHVIRSLERLESATRRRFRLRIHDRGPCDPGNSGVPIRYEVCARIAIDDSDSEADFGAIVLPSYEAKVLFSGGTVAAVQEADIASPEEKFDAYLMMGFPVTARREKKRVTGEGDTQVNRIVGTPLLPVTPVEAAPQELAGGIPRFIAKIDPNDDPRLANIQGMSGGPIFGVRRKPGGLETRLVAIQSSWLPDSRIIAAGYAQPFVHVVRRKLLEAGLGAAGTTAP